MRIETIFILCFCGLAIIGVGYINHQVNEADWWTEVFCIEQHGLLREMFGPDVCYINNTEYQAIFGEKERCSNNTKYGCDPMWSLGLVTSKP